MRDPNIVLMGIYEEFAERPSIGIEDLIACARADQCDRVVIALPLSAKERLEVLLSKLAMLPVEVQLCPDASTLPCPMFGCSPVGNLLGLDVQRAPLNARGVLVKALMDYVIASIALVAFSPLMLLIAIAIKVDTRGPVFFVQSRHGYNQRIIRFIKFRTMRVLEDGHTVVQAYRHDARVTRVGRFLRRSSLDELPQLINVIRGELSLVGPRAHPAHAERYRTRVAVQGFGNVGSFLAKFLAEDGATVIAISDSTSGLHNPNGIDVQAAIAHKRETGSLAGLKAADPISNDELLLLECDVLAPCALEQVITTDNADKVRAKIIVEGANGPITPAADEILEEKGVLVLPDILANAGGVVVSYFEWVQGLQEYFWKEAEVNAKLNDIVTRAFNETWATMESRDISMRLAAYGLAVQRVAEATTTRGIYP